MAEQRKSELNITRDRAIALGDSIFEFFSGLPKQRIEDVAPWDRLPEAPTRTFPVTRVQVMNVTTLQAAWKLTMLGLSPLSLNFANGKHPGGGFRSGSRAQEEVLCRSTALYPSIAQSGMYIYHEWRGGRGDSTDWTIVSHDVPVFRYDDGTPDPSEWCTNFISCAAPIAPIVGYEKSALLLRQRIRRLYQVAHAYGFVSLVLGAWGCGAFRNDPRRTAFDFRDILEKEFAGAFSHIIFAITDWSPERRFIEPFHRVFYR